MSFATLTAKIDALRQKAEAIRVRNADLAAGLNNDQNLSLQGRQAQAAESLTSARNEMTALQAEEDQLIAAEIKSLTQSLAGSASGTSSDVINFRDAQDRAARLADAREARDAMARALTLDDQVLAQAILHRSFQDLFNEPIELYLAQFPQKRQVAEDLYRVHKFAQDVSRNFHRQIAYSVGETRILPPTR